MRRSERPPGRTDAHRCGMSNRLSIKGTTRSSLERRPLSGRPRFCPAAPAQSLQTRFANNASAAFGFGRPVHWDHATSFRRPETGAGCGAQPKALVKRGCRRASCGPRGRDALFFCPCGRPPGQERGKRMGSPPRCLCCRSSFAEPTHCVRIGGRRFAAGRSGRHRRVAMVSDIETAHLISCHRNVGCMTGYRRVSRWLF
jgi:hypothetical protein